MDRKAIMGVAAIAGIGLLLYLRKPAASTPEPLPSSFLTNATAGWASMPQIVVNTRPAVVDGAAAGKAPAAAPAPVPAAAPAAGQVPVFGGGSGGTAAAPTPTWNSGQQEWVQSNGAPVDDSYTYGHLTPSQRGNKTDAQLSLSILGY